ncbi:MAG: hypothetical protein B7X49_17830 [Acidiphilium sp. 34-64-41]|nr:MAG: hypothetical protein B7X49_17830 [Acidiphilium sp. 34-64-41]
MHQVFRGGHVQPLDAAEFVLSRPSDRIAEEISPGQRFEAGYANFIDARVADRVDEIRAHVHDGRLARIAAADAALRAAQATGNRAAIRSAEMVAAGARRVSAPDAAEMLRAAEANVAAKLRASMARSDKDAQVERSTAARPATNGKFPPFGGIS